MIRAHNLILKFARLLTVLFVVVSILMPTMPAFAAETELLKFKNKQAILYEKNMVVGQVEIVEFAKAVSLAQYGVSDESLKFIEFDKLGPGEDGYHKFIIKAKKPGYGEITFQSGNDTVKLAVIVQNDYQLLEQKLNSMFGIPDASPEERIKVTPASYVGEISDKAQSHSHIYLSGLVKTPKEALLAVSFAANSVGDHGIKIYSNPAGQLRQKDLDSNTTNTAGSSAPSVQNNSFAEFYESTNKLIDTNNLHRDLVLASEGEKVISYIRIKEPRRFAAKVRFLEMDARYLDEFRSALSLTGAGGELAGAAGSTPVSVPAVSAASGLSSATVTSNFDASGLLGASTDIISGNIVSGTLKIFNNTRINSSFNDLLNEGVIRIVNEFSFVTHSGERVSLGKGVRFPIPKSNNFFGGNAISVEYIPIGFKGELKITGLDSGLIDAQLASRLSTAEPGSAGTVNGLVIPIFKEEYVNSGVMLQDNQEVILNAFLTEAETVTKGTSPLGRVIPFLGKSKRKEKSKNILFITLKVDELEPNSKKLAKQSDEFHFPHVELEKNRNIYSDFIKDLRNQEITDTLDLKKLDSDMPDSISIDFDDFDEDPIDISSVDFLPGIKEEEI